MLHYIIIETIGICKLVTPHLLYSKASQVSYQGNHKKRLSHYQMNMFRQVWQLETRKYVVILNPNYSTYFRKKLYVTFQN